MHEDFAGNAFGTSKALELTSSLQTFSGSVSPLDMNDYYSFNLSNHSSFNLTLSGLDANADVELLNSRGEVLQNLAQLGTSSESLFTTLDAGSYYIKVYSGAETTTDYNLNLSAIPNREATSLQNRDSLTGFDNPSFDTGVFTVGSSGQVSLDYLFDGGAYQGELAIFSLQGMEQFETDVNEFIAEAARRALSNSDFGHVVISDSTQGARFHGSLLGEPDYNSGDYLGVNTFSMRPGDTFGVMLVPNGTVQEVFANPGAEGAIRPLFSLSTANPNDVFHLGQVADVNGKGNTFVMEDLRVDGFSDKDYDDVMFQLRGATGQAVKLDEVIDSTKDWRSTELGKNLMEFIKPSENQPLIGVIDTGLSANNPDINPFHVHLGHDYVAGDGNPLLQPDEGSEHGTHVTGIIAATQDNGIGIDGINDQAPIYVTRATGSGQWAQALTEIVDAAKESGQPNAIANLSLDLTQVNPDGSVTTRYELTPEERAALEYARQNGVLIVVAAGNDGGTMSALGQASQEFDNIITVGSVDYQGNRADYSSFGKGLDIVAAGGTVDEPVISTVGSGADLDWLKEELDQLTTEVEVDVRQDSMSVMAQNTFQEVFKPLSSSLGEELNISADNVTVDITEVSTEGSRADTVILTPDADAPQDSAYMMAQNAVQEASRAFSATGTSGTSLPDLPEDLTPEEQQAYDEAVKEIDKLVFDYLDAASVKISLDLLDEYFAAGLDVTSRFLDAFDENLADTLLKAQEALGDAATDQSTSTAPDSSVPLDLGLGGMFGTSVATAKVTGAASLVWAANPELSYVQVNDILKQTAVDLNTPGWDEQTGSGLVNIAAAVELAKNTQPQAYQPQPLLSPLTWTGEGQVTPSERAAEVSEFKGKYYEWVPYTVREGDNLSTIAYLQLGNGTAEYYNFIFERNRSNPDGFNSISDPNFIKAGWKIFIPVEDPGYLQRQEEERRRQEEIRRAEEEQRRAEEELRRAEEELRRQEQIQALLIEISKTEGLPIRSWVSNSVTVYEFATGQMFVQADGRYAFYTQQALKVAKELTGVSQLITENLVDPKGFWKTVNKPSQAVLDLLSPGSFKELFTQPNGLIGGSALDLAARLFPAEFLIGAAKTRDFLLNDKVGKKITGAAKFVTKISDQADEYLVRAAEVGKLGKFGKAALRLNVLLDVGITALDVATSETDTEKGRAALKGGASIAAGIAGTLLSAGNPVVGAAASIATSLAFDAGFWVADEYGDEINSAIGSAGKAIGDGINAVSSAYSEAVTAAKEKAQAAVETAKAAAEKANVNVQQALVAYQNFQVKAQNATTQILQKAEKVLREGAANVYNTVIPPRVAQHVANYANQAIQRASNFIDNTKHFVSNAIETGKQFINNVIETGKQAYENVKNFVFDTYEKGKEVVTETFNSAVKTVNNVVSSITNPIKSLFGW